MARRKKEPLGVHRAKIAEAASACFLEKGVAATTVDEIARAAGYSKATLYVYFANKEEIFFSLVHRHMQRLHRTMEEIVLREFGTRAQWIEGYLALCFAVRALCRDYPLYFEGMIGDIPVDVASDDVPQTYRDICRLGQSLTELVGIMIRKGVPLGVFRAEDDPEAVTLFLWGGLSGIVRMAERKKAYFRLLGLGDDDFLRRAFLALLRGCPGLGEARP